MEPSSPSLMMALLAGMVSFLSPCVLPLVPAYIGYLSGQAVVTPEGGRALAERFATFLHALGIDPMTEYFTNTGRPAWLVPEGRIMTELF